jgi:3-hydroxyisobutyrate dehydrogenase-like beta-hydroxyacid dehydrogenase
LAKTPAEAAQGDVVITMLADDTAVESAAFGADGVLGTLRPSAIDISMSTINVALAERLAEAHRAKRQGFVSAPVFGRPEATAAAKLYVIAAAPPTQSSAACRCSKCSGSEASSSTTNRPR